MTGLQGELRDRLVGSTAHVYVFKVGGIKDPEGDVKRLREIPDVIGAAPVVVGLGMIQAGAEEAFISIKGVVPELEPTVTNVSNSMKSGSLAALTPTTDGPAGIVLGADLATKLGVSLGDVVQITTPNGVLVSSRYPAEAAKIQGRGNLQAGAVPVRLRIWLCPHRRREDRWRGTHRRTSSCGSAICSRRRKSRIRFRRSSGPTTSGRTGRT